MKIKYILAAIVLAAGCGTSPGPAGPDGADGEDGPAGADGAAAVISVADEAAGANCATGGTKIESGVDSNGNGTLDADEISSTSYVCDGDEGAEGPEGPTGPAGTAGTAGAAGDDSLISTTAEAAGANCANGGTRIDYGVDDDGNGTLDTAEIDGTSYVCDGAAGASASQTLVSVVAEAAGANCADGGQAISWGTDANGNGTLDSGEIDGTQYVCNGADGSAGTNGLLSLVNTTPEPAGSNCANGGVRIDIGLDDNANGTLETAEIDSTDYVCDGQDRTCDSATEVAFAGRCYYLDGSAGVCESGYVLAPQSVLTSIASDFIGKTYKNTQSGNCCITHADQTAEGQDWGFDGTDCNGPGPFSTAPLLGGAGCTDANQSSATQLTICMTN